MPSPNTNRDPMLILILFSLLGCTPENAFSKTAHDALTDTGSVNEDATTPDSEDEGDGTVEKVPGGTFESDSAEDTSVPATCEFEVWNGNWNDDGTKTIVTTNTMPAYVLMGPTTGIIDSGDDVTLEFDIRSRYGCGPVNIDGLMFFVWSEGGEDYEWMKNPSGLGESSLEIIDPAESFESSVPMMTAEADPTIAYCWDDRSWITGCPAEIPTETIPAVEERRVRFVWSSEGVPQSSNLLVRIEIVAWTDPSSGEQIMDYSTADNLAVEVTVR